MALAATAAAAPVSAQVSLVGEWSGRYHEDQPDRVPGEEAGDYSGLPINEAARLWADSWTAARVSVPEHQCQPYALPHIFHGPLQIRIWEERHPDTQELIAIRQYIGTYQQWRTIWMDGRPHPPTYAPHTWMGFSTGEYHGDILTVTTTHIKQEFLRRSGIPSSDRTTVIEHYIRHGNLLSHVSIATDPVYLTEPYIRSQEFVLMERGNQNWLYNCEYVTEVPRLKHQVPHYLPGQNSTITEFARNHGVPQEAVRGGAEGTYPEYFDRLRTGRATSAGLPLPERSQQRALRPEQEPETPEPGDVRAVHVQGNVYMIVGAGANIAVQIGDDGVLVVDTGMPQHAEKVLAAIRELTSREIRWVINTGLRPDHVGGNEAISFAGRTVNGNPAAIIAHENASMRMVKAGVPDKARPYNTYFEESRDFPFNGEPVILYHDASADTDANTVVMFRRSDVIVAGDFFDTTSYPLVDAENGGTVAGTIQALNRILDLAVPSKYFQDAGTYVIPGHGRISDEADVVEYRDMVVIVSDRIQDMVKRGMTLEQVKAARPTLDYDARYGREAAGAFIETIYREFSGAATAAGAGRGAQ